MSLHWLKKEHLERIQMRLYTTFERCSDCQFGGSVEHTPLPLHIRLRVIHRTKMPQGGGMMTTVYTSVDLCFSSAAAHRAIARIRADVTRLNNVPSFTDDDLLLARISIVAWTAQGLPRTTALTQIDLITATCPSGKNWVEVAHAYILTLHEAGTLEQPTFVPREEGGYWLSHGGDVRTMDPIATRAEAIAAVMILPGIGRINDAQCVELIERVIPTLFFPTDDLFVDPAKRFQVLRHLLIA